MEVQQIAAERLLPNPWNVNRMAQGMKRKLSAYLRREGLVEPIVVRPHPEDEDRYQILGGYHRWRICHEELGYDTLPCVVVEGLDEKRAKILSINLNSMKGEAVPSLLSELLHDLQGGMPLEDLEATLPYDAGEIEDFVSLMQLPEGLAEELQREATERDGQAPTVLTIVLEPGQAELWAKVCEELAEEIAGSRNPQARALECVLEDHRYFRELGESLERFTVKREDVAELMGGFGERPE